MHKNVVIITGDPLSSRMAGPAIRAWNIASQLSQTNSVRLLSMTKDERKSSAFETGYVSPDSPGSITPHVEWADVIVVQGYALSAFPAISKSDVVVVVDLYDPIHLEQLEQARSRGAKEWEATVADATAVLNEQLIRGDYFVCASPRQRDFWLGQLAAVGRLNPYTYAADPHLTRLIDLLPFGLTSEAPIQTRHALRGTIPGIHNDDKILIWAGGLYDWFDPETLIRAIKSLSEKRSNLRLFFLGTAHPHPGVPEMPVVKKSRELAAELGILNTHVFFNDTWVDYDERQNYLLDADAGVSTHFDHLETEFSFRTRILDYLWAGLPTITTSGDYFAELVDKHKLGAVAPAEDIQALSRVLEEVLYDSDVHAASVAQVATMRSRFFWEVVTAPLSEFIRNASIAADRKTFGKRPEDLLRFTKQQRGKTLAERRVRAASHLLKTEGIGAVVKRIRRRSSESSSD